MRVQSATFVTIVSVPVLLCATAAIARDCDPLRVYANLEIVTNDNTGNFAFPVLVNNSTKYFMAGTNSTYSSISDSVVEELGIETTATSATMMDGSGNLFVPSLARPEQFRIGNLQADYIPLQVNLGGGPDGVIGANILREYDIDLNFADRTFALIDQNHCSAQLAHWGNVPIGSVAMDITRVQGTATIRVAVNGVNLDADINLASGDTVMNQTIARRRLDVDLDDDSVEEIG